MLRVAAAAPPLMGSSVEKAKQQTLGLKVEREDECHPCFLHSSTPPSGPLSSLPPFSE